MTDLLSRLRNDDAPLDALARLLWEDLLGRTLGEVLDPEGWASGLADVARGWAASDRAQEQLLSAWDGLLRRLEADERRLRDVVPGEVRRALDRLAAQPYQPDRETLLALLDREPVRKLLREILQATLVDFGKKMAAPVRAAPIARRLGAFGSLGERAKRRAGILGALAEEVAGAVGGELERQVERKASEFADTALSGVLQRIVELLADPARAGDQAALRGALLDGAWDWTGPVAAAEFGRGDPEAVTSVLREALGAWTAQEGFEDTVRGWLLELREEHGHRTLGEVLADLELLEPAERQGVELLRQRAHDFVTTAPFAAWLESLLEPR